MNRGASIVPASAATRARENLHEEVAVLFRRLHQRDQSVRVEIDVREAHGSQWLVTVRFAATRVERGGGRELAVRDEVLSRGPAGDFVEVQAASVDDALRSMKADLGTRLGNRVKSDVGALELAGLPFDWTAGYSGPKPIVVEADLDEAPGASLARK